MSPSRRDFGKVALAALPASRLLARPDSKFGGVQIGINAPYAFRGAFNSGDECLEHTDITSPEAFGRPESWETAMSYRKYNGINLDIGRFTAGKSTSPRSGRSPASSRWSAQRHCART